MINEENLNKLYEGILNANELTTKELNGYGFNSKDLADLIEQGYLERVKRGCYSFKQIDELFYYGKRLIAAKEYDKATECFKKCYELDPNHLGACFQLFLRSISNKDYESAFKYFEVLSDTENPYYNADSNFYLYLLSIITDIPDKHKEYARYLKIEDIRVDFNDKRYQDIPEQNKIRIAVLQRKFPYALKQLKDLTIKHGSLTVQDIITRVLLFQAVEVENLSKNTLIELAKNKKYEEIVNYLEAKEKKHNLSITDSYTLKLVNEIIHLQETQQVPEKTIFKSEKLFEAIDGCNYDLALSLSESYNAKKNIINSENTIYLLLSDICSMTKHISSSSQTPIEIIEDEHLEEPVVEDLYEDSILDSKEMSLNSSFSDVIGYLMKCDLEKAFITLRSYIDSINKKEYEFLIVDLIKLSIIEKDIAFTKPMVALTYVSRDNFKFDISNYIQEFYIALSQNRFDEARIYLDIISKSNSLGQECILTEGLQQVLNNSEEMMQYKRNNPILDNAEQAFIKSQNLNIPQTKDNSTTIKISKPIAQIESPKVDESKILEKQQSVTKEEDVNSLIETIDSEKEFIENKYELLLNGQGIVLLKPMNNERRKIIHNIVKEYPDMVSFSIGEGDNRQIVLRYKPFIDEHVDLKNLINMGSLAYKKGDYDSCIECNLQLLQVGEPKAFIYANLGLAYMKKMEKDRAIDYLTIATQLSKQENGDFDFTELIASLNGLIDKEDKKPHFKMKTEDFDNDIQNHYGIENLAEITSYILESGLDVKTACQELGMTDEQINIIRLIYAREFYSQGNYEKGDQFLKSVEKSKNKTKFTLKLFEEIRKNKRFYINRANEDSQQLVLTLQPQKN
ncbi:MAG: R3H domain-containing nucleic acid-binding protein [Bacilli bacterium]